MYIKHTKTLRLNDIGETPARSHKILLILNPNNLKNY